VRPFLSEAAATLPTSEGVLLRESLFTCGISHPQHL
jgi:hypothetical protein